MVTKINRTIASSKLRKLLAKPCTKYALTFYERISKINRNKEDLRHFIVLEECINSSSKISIQCVVCGYGKKDKWRPTPNNLVTKGANCPVCSKKQSNLKQTKTKEQHDLEILNITKDPQDKRALKRTGDFTRSQDICAYLCLNCNTPLALVATEVTHKGVGCTNCNNLKLAELRTFSKKEWLQKLRKILTTKHYILNLNLIERIPRRNIVKIKHKVCGAEYRLTIDTILDSRKKEETCPLCNPASKPEKELQDYVESIYKGSIKSNTRNILLFNKELDIYFPDINLAIEYNGNYWHSTLHKNKNYHRLKSEEAKDKGITLFHIWEDQWKNKRLVIKSMIKSKLGLIKTKISGRKCEIIKLDKTPQNFYLENHLQNGKVSATTSYALTLDEVIVSVMSFKKNVLVRFCSEKDVLVHGAFSKLLKQYIKDHNPKEIVSFSDNDYSDGSIYKNNSFTLVKKTKEDYFYTDRYSETRYHKFTMRKQAIKKKYSLSEEYINSHTEFQIMDELKYLRCYNSGKKKWILKL